ncbi:MAG: DUF3616 domain-containing protein [Thiobacillaceae bacterium]|jgi:hypothetical protein|nr:DUF3616 domain-containing protein [Thiobacillaceae bacterium]
MPTMPAFQPLTGLYEPSAIQQLPDGRFLVAEDEKAHPFSLVTIAADGQVSSTPLLPPENADDAAWKLDDLEALAIDRAGYVYALTSHSRSAVGKAKKARDKLVRFRVEGRRMTAHSLARELRPALVAAHPELAAAAGILEVKAGGGLNIEALEIGGDGQRLFFGFRSPLIEGRAVIACVESLAAIFDAGETPRVAADLITLDLGGNGIRGMATVPALGGHLIISGPVGRQPVPFRLWFWSGRVGEPARRVSVGARDEFQHAEGVTPAVIDGQARIVIVSDDGSRADGRDAHYLLFDPAQLVIAG